VTLDEAQVGERVLYITTYALPEPGTITSVSRTYVFVRYDDQPADAPGRATPPEQLMRMYL
jgi:hypothetical protein